MKILVPALGAMALVACSGEPAADTAPSTANSMAADSAAPASVMADSTDSMTYLQQAAAGDLYEIESSRLALEKVQDPQVQSFAQMMIDHHQTTTQQLTAAAQQAGLSTGQPQLSPLQQQQMDALRAAQGEEFASTYLSQQREAHQMALQLHQTYAQQGDNPALKATASKAVPIIQQHISRLEQLSAS